MTVQSVRSTGGACASAASSGAVVPRSARSSCFAELHGLVCSLSWPAPDTVAKGRGALDALADTRDRLTVLAPTLANRELHAAVSGLATRAGWVLDGWNGVVAMIEPQAWSSAHSAGLAGDLVQIAQAGARILNRIEQLESPVPPDAVAERYGAGLAGSAVVRRRREAAWRRTVGGAPSGRLVAATRSVIGAQRGGVLVLGAAGIAALVLAAGWYARFELRDGQPFSAGSAAPAGLATARARTRVAGAPSASGAARSTAPSPSASASPGSAPVTSIQMLTLGSSAAVQRIEVELLIHAWSTAGFELHLSWGRTSGSQAGSETRELAGATGYDLVMPISVPATLCSGSVVIEASAGTVTSTAATTAGPCPAVSSTS